MGVKSFELELKTFEVFRVGYLSAQLLFTERPLIKTNNLQIKLLISLWVFDKEIIDENLRSIKVSNHNFQLENIVSSRLHFN
jgi:hypothetical protein